METSGQELRGVDLETVELVVPRTSVRIRARSYRPSIVAILEASANPTPL